MARFGRKETFIASHYTHGYKTSPVAFHHLQPLTYGPYMAYGDLGWTLSKVLAPNRKMQSTLRKEGANTAVYDLYDAVMWLDDLTGDARFKPGIDIRTISTYSAVEKLAANDSSADLKTAYWVMLAALILDDENLKGAANGLAESGYAKGTQPGSASLTNNITQTYQRGLDLVKGSSKLPKNTANWSDNTKRVIEQLQKGTGKAAVKARIDEAKKDEEAAKKNIPTDEGGVKPPEETKCEDTWWGKLPGYCTSQRAYTYAAYGVSALTVLGMAFWAYGKYKKAAQANPYPKLLGNPSAPGVMDGGPELEIANLPAAKKQEKNLANTAFRMEKK